MGLGTFRDLDTYLLVMEINVSRIDKAPSGELN